MKAKPDTGLREVGGAHPHPWEALANEVAARTLRLTRELSSTHPAHAALAAMSWHANQAITRQIGATYAVAMLVRKNAEAIATAGERTLPEGPLRSAVARTASWQVALANAAAESATRFGRQFGHLAFAFPRSRPL